VKVTDLRIQLENAIKELDKHNRVGDDIVIVVNGSLATVDLEVHLAPIDELNFQIHYEFEE